MSTKKFTVNIPQFNEARPVAEIVQTASQFESSIYLISGSKRINAKSIMGMMSLGLVNGKGLTLSADGADEVAALDELANYIQSA